MTTNIKDIQCCLYISKIEKLTDLIKILEELQHNLAFQRKINEESLIAEIKYILQDIDARNEDIIFELENAYTTQLEMVEELKDEVAMLSEKLKNERDKVDCLIGELNVMKDLYKRLQNVSGIKFDEITGKLLNE